MRRHFVPCVALILLACSIVSEAGSADWVLRSKDTTIPASLLGTQPPPDSVYLWRQRIITAGSITGSTRLYDREALKILTPSGASDAIFTSSYDDDSNVKIEGGWSVHGGGDPEKLDLNEVVTVNLSTAEYFSDHYVVAFRPPRLAPGDVAAYALSRKSHRDVYQWILPLQAREPIVGEQIVIDLPDGWSHRWRLTAAPAAYSGPLSGEGGNKAEYSFGPQPGISPEDAAPPVADREAAIEIAIQPPHEKFGQFAFRTWDDVASWFWSRSAPARAEPPAVDLSGQGDPIRAAARWVQSKIRYVAVEVGEGAYTPRTPAVVVNRLYGDCKDKAFLLRALLARAGVTAYPVLTLSRDEGAIDPEFPSPIQFNHLILAIRESGASGLSSEVRLPDGPAILFDPTSEDTPFGELPAGLQGSRGLLVNEGHGVLLDFPTSPPQTNHWLRRIEAQVSSEGRLTAQIVDQRSGAMASRHGYRILSPVDREASLSRELGRELGGSRIGQITFAGLDDPSTPMEIKYELQADSFLRHVGSLTLLPVLPVSGRPRRLADLEHRQSPITLGVPRLTETVCKIRLPDGMRLDGVPKSADVANPYLRYAFETKVEGDHLLVHELFEVRRREIPTKDLAAWKSIASAAAKSSAMDAVLVPK
jgi:Domain of Unknown Function with PDB structure (DUF3857)